MKVDDCSVFLEMCKLKGMTPHELNEFRKQKPQEFLFLEIVVRREVYESA